MKKLLKISLLLFGIAIIGQGCFGFGGKKSDEASNNEASDSNESAGGTSIPGLGDLTKAVEGLEKAAKDMEQGKTTKPVNFRKLKELLPSKVDGMASSDVQGETTGAMGFSISNASALYKEDKKRVKMSISDAGGMQLALFGMAAWANVANIDKEDENGYERTSKYKGYKSYEKYNNKKQEGEFVVIVGDRYLVQAEGDNVTIDELKEAVTSVDLSALASLKPDPEE